MLSTTARWIILLFVLVIKISFARFESGIPEIFGLDKANNDSSKAINNENTFLKSAFSNTVAVPVFPGNDECTTAYLIPTSTSCLNSRGTLSGATASPGIPIGSCTGNPDDDVWYKFVATKANPTITLTNIAASITGSGGGIRMQILSGSCGSLSSVACGITSIAASGLLIGNTYYIRVYSNGSTSLTNATFNICITDPLPEIVTDSTNALFYIDTIGKNLGYPWEITYGPDDSLWITEARGYRVLRVSASRTGTQKNIAPQQVLKIPLATGEINFGRSVNRWPQGGMEGFAIHPEFMSNINKRWIYIAYVYKQESCPSGTDISHPNGFICKFRSKIIRCHFYFAADAGNPTALPHKDTLVVMDTVISNLPGSNDHNSGRMKIGPVVEGPDNTYKLYYTIGDMGAGQFNNDTRTNYAQTKDTCEGKILRLNTEPDADGVPGSPVHEYDKWREWIPNDNPFTHSAFTSLRTPIYSYGHRNAQGLIWGNINGTWRLYSSEHGDHSDDEVNIIQAGKNYGWPKVAGVADDNYTTSDDASDGFTFNNILANQSVANETTWANSTTDYTNPIFTFFNWSPAQIETSNTGNLFNWPTIAPSSIDFYSSPQIEGWQNSLLITSLKYGMYRLKLKSTGDAIDSSICTNVVDTFPLLHSWRVRDIAISTDGRYIWAVIDSTGNTSGPTGGFDGSGNTNATKSGGMILKLSYKNFVVLPVNILSFTGRLVTDNIIQLNWEAVIDKGHSYFEIEKSVTGNNFISIGRVNGSVYEMIDHTPLPGNNYYRLKAVDISGKITYSKVINITYNPSGFVISLFPNPMNDFSILKIAALQADNLHIEVADMQGHIMVNESKFIGIGKDEVRLETKKWLPQFYILKVTNEHNRLIYTQKLIKL